MTMVVRLMFMTMVIMAAYHDGDDTEMCAIHGMI